MTSPHQGRFIDNPERPPARHDSLAGQSAFADRRSAPALPSVLRCARPPSPTFCAASVRQACRPPPSFPSDAFGSRKRRSLIALFRTVFRQQTKSPKAGGVRSRPILSISAEAHHKTQRLRSGGRAPPIPHQLALPAQTFPRRRDKRCRRHGMVSVLQVRATQRALSPMHRDGRMFPLHIHCSPERPPHRESPRVRKNISTLPISRHGNPTGTHRLFISRPRFSTRRREAQHAALPRR